MRQQQPVYIFVRLTSLHYEFSNHFFNQVFNQLLHIDTSINCMQYSHNLLQFIFFLSNLGCHLYQILDFHHTHLSFCICFLFCSIYLLIPYLLIIVTLKCVFDRRICIPKPKEYLQPPKDGTAKGGFFLENLEETWPCQHTLMADSDLRIVRMKFIIL